MSRHNSNVGTGLADLINLRTDFVLIPGTIEEQSAIGRKLFDLTNKVDMYDATITDLAHYSTYGKTTITCVDNVQFWKLVYETGVKKVVVGSKEWTDHFTNPMTLEFTVRPVNHLPSVAEGKAILDIISYHAEATLQQFGADPTQFRALNIGESKMDFIDRMSSALQTDEHGVFYHNGKQYSFKV